jgi:hypothetical protein
MGYPEARHIPVFGSRPVRRARLADRSLHQIATTPLIAIRMPGIVEEESRITGINLLSRHGGGACPSSHLTVAFTASLSDRFSASAYLATPKSMSWRNTSPPFSLT